MALEILCKSLVLVRQVKFLGIFCIGNMQYVSPLVQERIRILKAMNICAKINSKAQLNGFVIGQMLFDRVNDMS